MKKLRNGNALLITLGVLAVLCSGILALIYIPSPKFEPVAYEPIAPDSINRLLQSWEMVLDLQKIWHRSNRGGV